MEFIDSRYTYKVIRKANGSTRILAEPKDNLKQIQTKILNLLYTFTKVSYFTHGFVLFRNIITNAIPHVGKKYILKIDIKDFFTSIHEEYFIGRKLLEKERGRYQAFLSNFYTNHELFVETNKGFVLPQGAPTSPWVANLYLTLFDFIIVQFILRKEYKIEYTRYADDITLSGNDIRELFSTKCFVYKKLESYYLEPNKQKFKVISRNHPQVVCGVLVNEKIAMPKKRRQRVKALKYLLEKGKIELTNQIRGELAFADLFTPKNVEKFSRRVITIERYSKFKKFKQILRSD